MSSVLPGVAVWTPNLGFMECNCVEILGIKQVVYILLKLGYLVKAEQCL